MTRRTVVEREAERLVREMIGEHHEEESDLPLTIAAMRRVERATLARVRREIEAERAALLATAEINGANGFPDLAALGRAMATGIKKALVCVRPERKR